MSKTNDSYLNAEPIAVAPSDEIPGIEQPPTPKRGLKIERHYTTPGVHPYDEMEWEHRSSAIHNEKGEAIFQQKAVEVPSSWSQLATDIVVSKYFRKAGVPETGGETSVRQVIHRVAHTIRQGGETFGGYFATPSDADAFEAELTYLLLTQRGAFNSPVFFNCGLWHEYSIKGGSGNWYWDFEKNGVVQATNNYEHPQCSACFIQSVHDDLMSIFDLVKNEARVFKYGSGSGSNFSKIRGRQEKLSGGGTSSGLMSFLEVFDRAAGATKSGGTTRRAAKMVCLDMVHPEIVDFINWKVNEEKKVAALIAAGYPSDFNGEAYKTVSGQNSNNSVRITDEFMNAYLRGGKWHTTLRTTGEVYETFEARDLMRRIAQAAWACADPGVQFDTTINDWHTCANTDRIYSSNPCCITGDTLIAVADGRNAVSIRELVGQEVPVYAWDHSAGKTVMARMWNIGVKRQGVPVYRVTLDDGSFFRATDDHLIMLRDGSYRQVKDLKAGDSLNPFHSKVRQPATTRTPHRYVYTGHGWRAQYRWVWESANGKQPEGYHIHHQDFDSLNDRLDNLQLLKGEEHEELHREKMLGDNNPARRCMTDEWRANIARAVQGEKNPHYGKLHTPEARAKMRQASAKRWLSPDQRTQASTNARQWMAEARREGRHIGRHAGPRYERCCPACRQNFVTAREEQIFCSQTCRYSPLGLAMIGAKGGDSRRILPETAPRQRGFWEYHSPSPEHREKLRQASIAAARPEDKRRAAMQSIRNKCLKAARLLLDSGQEVRLDQWDELRPLARALGAYHVPQREVMQRFFVSDADLREHVQCYNHKVVSVKFDGVEDVYDGTVDGHHNFAIITSQIPSSVAARALDYSGCFVHNSEYMFLDDTACNLSSINLLKFLGEDGRFDVEGFRHACRIFITAQEILVDSSSYPTNPIAQNSHDYRPLGLGYANLGTLLMVNGIPYDSEAGYAICGAITAIMCGEAYRTSAEIAAIKGPFAGFEKNREPMLRVMNKHRASAYRLNGDACPPHLLKAAQQTWDAAVEIGEKYGYRNAQATVLAPTGCLVGNSLVNTDRGLVRLKTLGNPKGNQWQDVAFRVYTDEGIQEGTKFFINGVAPTRLIRTRCGYEIQGTPNHQIKVAHPQTGQFVWKHLSEIQQGDLVPLAMNAIIGEPRRVALPPLGELYWTSDYETKVPATMTPELAEFVGYFMGDGSLHSKGLRFCVSEADYDVVELLSERIQSLFNLTPHLTKREGYYEVLVNSVRLTHWWEACGFAKLEPTPGHQGKGYQPYIPDAILYPNDPLVYAAFLRGLFEADGTVANGVPYWSTTQPEFSQEVKNLLLTLGYPTINKVDTSGWGQSDLHVLRLRNLSYCPKFYDEIGFLSSRKNAAINRDAKQTGNRDYVYLPPDGFQKLAPRGSRHYEAVQLALRRHGGVPRQRAEALYAETGDEQLGRVLRFFYDRVETNIDGGMAPTYDLSVPSNVTYTANGFLSHNTIGLLMDCDTTGIEPDFALVKFKKLAGGGYFKIINGSVPRALKGLGYTDEEIDDIVTYAQGTSSLIGSPHINNLSLKAKGLTDEEMGRIEAALPGVFELSHALHVHTIGKEGLARLGFSPEKYNAPDFDLLRELGFTKQQIDEANNAICGMMTLEGAPHLKAEHLPIFDCANRCGKYGQRYIESMGHVRMIAAAQPFLSGAISKTINMPHETTVEAVEALYVEAWKLGLKAVAIYRDGSKLSQPLSASRAETGEVEAPAETRPTRRRLPDERPSITHKFSIAGHEGYITVGLYEDGSPGEMFLKMSKEGSTISGLMDTIAVMTSVSLQYSVPLEFFVNKFSHVRFEPSGFTNNKDIPIAKSIIDYVFRWLGLKFLPKKQAVEEGDEIFDDQLVDPRQLHPRSSTRSLRPYGSDADRRSTVQRLEARERRIAAMQSDAPVCHECGTIMVRNGSCYRCLNCGATSGCS